MKKMKWRTTLACAALVAITLMGVALAAAAGQGSQADPLVTLSYVTKVIDEMEERLAQRIDFRAEELSGQLEERKETTAFMTVEVSAGQTLLLNSGTQLIFRTGHASCTDGMTDLTDGSIPWGDMAANHLYIATKEDQIVTVSEASLFLIQGGYSVS